MAGYAFARLRFPGKQLLFFGLGASFLVPGVMLLIPSFMLMRGLGWIDTHHALIWPPLAGFFGVFFMRQFFLAIPSELAEAAVIDGASAFGIYWRVFLPLSRPAVATLGIFTFLFIWNDFTWPLVVLNSDEMRTLPVGLGGILGRVLELPRYRHGGRGGELGAGAGGLHHLPAADYARGHGDGVWRAVDGLLMTLSLSLDPVEVARRVVPNQPQPQSHRILQGLSPRKTSPSRCLFSHSLCEMPQP